MAEEGQLTDDDKMLGFIDHITMDQEETNKIARWNKNRQVNQVKKWDDDVKKMNQALVRDKLTSGIMEIYFPKLKRVNGMAEILGLLPGMSLDPSELDVDGKPWEFNVKEKRDKAEQIVREKRALLLI